MLVEPHHLGSGPFGQPAHHVVAPIEDSEVIRLRELDSARLQRRVALKRAVPVEMVGRDVEDDPDMEMRSFDGLQLKARELEHHPVLLGDFLHPIQDGVADVAADDHRLLTRGQHLAGERRRGRLAVGACDSDHRAFAEPQEELDLA